jgi:RhtB (resistance to homoserine/threonine) family protein
MPLFSDWLTVLAIGCLAVMTPGPNLAITLRNSLAYTRRDGVSTAAGLALGNLLHASYCLVGIGVVISRSIVLFNAIKWAGAAYLIYIGLRSLRARPQDLGVEGAGPPRSLGRLVAARSGFLTNLLNPKVTLFFLALFTQVIDPATPLPARAFYGATMVLLEFGWFALVATLISRRAVKARFLSVSHWVERATGAALVALGLRLAFVPADG